MGQALPYSISLDGADASSQNQRPQKIIRRLRRLD
jgi:hypothetical protein